MSFPFSLSRTILLIIIVIIHVTSLLLSVIALHDRTGGVFQIVAVCFGSFSLLIVIGCLCHQFMSHNEEASNTRNLCLFGICGLFDIAQAVSVTVHSQQGGGTNFCSDFANAGNPCIPAGVQLGMGYISPLLALIGFVISWIDRFPGAVQVMPRYPVTKAPSSQFAAYAHDLDGNYTRPPAKTLPRSRNNSGWSDVPLHC